MVNVSSGLANMAKLDFDDIQCERKKYAGTGLYAQSKLCNILFTFELQKRSDAQGWGLKGINI